MTGQGIVSCLGHDPETFYNNLLEVCCLYIATHAVQRRRFNCSIYRDGIAPGQLMYETCRPGQSDLQSYKKPQLASLLAYVQYLPDSDMLRASCVSSQKQLVQVAHAGLRDSRHTACRE